MGEFLGKMHNPEKYGFLNEKKVLVKRKHDEEEPQNEESRYIVINELKNDDPNVKLAKPEYLIIFFHNY
jgi:hypothetical protein